MENVNNELIKKINFCKEFINDKIEETNNRMKELNTTLEESFLFNRSSDEYGNFKFHNKYSILNCVLTYQKIIYDEISKINSFKYMLDDPDDILSGYGSLYCGDGVLYYNDVLVRLNDEMFLQVILNHIIHYTGERFLIREHKNSTKSLVLLSFYHLRLFDTRIKYALSERKVLYEEPKYKKIIENYIIFEPKKSLKDFIIKNNIESNFFKVKNNIIHGVRLIIQEYAISYDDYGTSKKFKGYNDIEYVIEKNLLDKYKYEKNDMYLVSHFDFYR